MTRKLSLTHSHTRTTACPHGQAVLQAERDYYDCISRFGCDSAEAHVAGLLWRQLRRKPS